MNAIQFIKDHGVESAKKCIEEANAYGGFWVNAKTLELSKQIPSYDAVSIPDIQRLVKSIDTVNSFGGLEDSKAVVKMGKYYKYLKKAIADYEQLFGNTETLGGEHV